MENNYCFNHFRKFFLSDQDQMIRSIIADQKKGDILLLENLLTNKHSYIQICGKSDNISSTSTLIDVYNPELLIINVELLLNRSFTLKEFFMNSHYEFILIAKNYHFATDAFNCCASGYLIKPVKENHFSTAVNNAVSKINEKKENTMNKLLVEKYLKQSSNEDVIGIPTIEGLEFISINDIIRCEGLQKCTRVISIEKTDLISSYNLGEFRKMLEPFGFYSPHKSHLINLRYIRKYHREGNILMINNSYVPVAKRKKREFLKHVNHL